MAKWNVRGGKMKSRYEEMEHEAALFHAENPKVWEYFVRFTFEVIERGFNHYSVNGVFERIRWEADLADLEGNSTFKLNNNHRPFYARWFMDRYPEHKGFFRVRVMPSRSRPATGLPALTPADFAEETM